MIEVKTPSFASQEAADDWLERTELFQQSQTVRNQSWGAEDGTHIGYTTVSLPEGGFASFRYRPPGSGFGPVEVLFIKHHPTRKAARARATALYVKYSPRWAKRHPDFK